MATNTPLAATWPLGSDSTAPRSLKQRHDTMVMVQWALAIACSYLVLFSHGSPGDVGFGALVIVAFLAANLIFGRLPPNVISSAQGNLSVAALDAVLIVASLYVASQLSVELIVLCLGILLLAVGGLSLGVIAAATTGLVLAYTVMVAIAGTESIGQSGTLLRVPFLFSAAITYAWLVEMGRSESVERSARATSELMHELATQHEAITRCQGAIGQGAAEQAKVILGEIAARNETMLAHVTHA